MNIGRKLLLLCVLSLGLPLIAQESADDQWTWLYQKSFSLPEFVGAHVHKVLTFSKIDIAPFTQVVFSWNARRPAHGYFTFFIQTRDGATQHWGKWHKMMDWGAQVQCSYMSEDAHSKYYHVRLETGTRYADAFRIKISAHGGAKLQNLAAIFVSVSDFNKFKPENVAEAGPWPSVVIDNVPQRSQFVLDHPRNAGLCSPTSTSMLVSYLLGKDIDPLDFAQKAYDTGLGVYGSWPFNMAHAYEVGKGKFLFTTARLHSFNTLYKRLQQGIPVVVSVRGALAGAAKAYEHGHLLVVIGFDAQNQQVICLDPAFKSDEAVLKYYPLKSFLAAWERSHRLAYLAEPTNAQQ
jgi:hypothetical protein